MNKPAQPLSKSRTPRPACQQAPACRVYQQPCGCGYLDAGTPCAHPQERRRFENAPEEANA